MFFESWYKSIVFNLRYSTVNCSYTGLGLGLRFRVRYIRNPVYPNTRLCTKHTVSCFCAGLKFSVRYVRELNIRETGEFFDEIPIDAHSFLLQCEYSDIHAGEGWWVGFTPPGTGPNTHPNLILVPSVVHITYGSQLPTGGRQNAAISTTEYWAKAMSLEQQNESCSAVHELYCAKLKDFDIGSESPGNELAEA